MEKLSAIHPLLLPSVGLLGLIIAAVIADIIIKRIVVEVVRTVAKRSKVTWDDALIEHNVFGRIVQLVPALIIYAGVALVPDLPEYAAKFIRNIAMEAAGVHWNEIDIASMPTESMRYAMVIIAAGPMLLIFPFFQRYFTEGLTVGSVKG